MRSREHKTENHDSIAAIIVTTNKVGVDTISHTQIFAYLNILDRTLGGRHCT